MLVRGSSDKGEKISVAKVLLLSWCFSKKDVKKAGLSFVQYVNCVPLLDGVNKSLDYICLR